MTICKNNRICLCIVLKAAAFDDGCNGLHIAAAKLADMHQQGVEIIEIAPSLEEAGADRPELVIALEEGLAEGAEQRNIRQFDLGMAVVDGGVDKRGDPAGRGEDIGRPDVTVDERRLIRFFQPVVEPGGESFDARMKTRRQPPSFGCARAHIEEALIAEEVDPARGPWIGLGDGGDERRLLHAEGRRGLVVEIGQQFGGVRLGTGIEAAAAIEPAQQQQLRIAVKHLRDRQRAMLGQVAQHVTFSL